jgi:hypothetical protein
VSQKLFLGETRKQILKIGLKRNSNQNEETIRLPREFKTRILSKIKILISMKTTLTRTTKAKKVRTTAKTMFNKTLTYKVLKVQNSVNK